MGIFKHLSTLLLLAICVSSCDIINPDEPTPFYVYIESGSIETDLAEEGSNSSKLTDVWITYEGNLIGAFSTPALVPIIPGSSKTLRLSGGIKDNGISTTRIKYPFLQPIDVEIDISSGKVDTIKKSQHVYHYKDNTRFLLLEDFEGQSVTIEAYNNNLNNFYVTRNPSEVFEGKGSLKIDIIPPDSGFAIRTFNEFEFGSFNFGSPTYVELNYKCDLPVGVGYVIKTSSGIENAAQHMVINTNNQWNKIYINLTEQIALIRENETARVFFISYLPKDLESGTVYFDNLKLVTFE